MKMMKIGVLLDSGTVKKRRRYGLNVFEAYIKEILAHAGVPFTMMTQIDELPAAKVDLVIVSVVPQDEQTAEALWHYAEQGGTLVAYGGLALLAERLGCAKRSRLDKGYARLPEYDFLTIPLRYLSAEAWCAGGEPCVSAGSLHASSPEGTASGALLQQWMVGQGAIHRWAVDIPTTVVHLRRGLSRCLWMVSQPRMGQPQLTRAF
ncbi:hypothetical protein [Paenibacillus chungangensis]|uniref:Gfo/Idh/MocA-like oxidoreductase N-terminal domain-containing protein n=1 Tax=Paenibacillus chungangensis TaxID=696535 RepID=A0ABW3HUE5_9BACL